MSEIADFLRARYAERRAIAEAARDGGEGRWHQDDPERYPGRIEDERGHPVVYDEGSPSEEQAAHIVANDPEDVIADLDAKLALVDDLLAERHEVVDDCWYTCAAATEAHDGGETCNDGRLGGPCDCGRDARVNRRLAILARPFAGHPDHKGEEWAP
ncbi:DUF6221 family protein [Streptomyces sp. NPDC127091]|uniref:DUF6221 family protein n=1 Tax=Streptomyces sp. NPDC127091 TaxID=3347134 RepID=UPI00365FF7CE